MLPNIDPKSALKKTMTISTTNNTKNNPTTTYYNKVKTTSKGNSSTIRQLETYKNKNINNSSNKSKNMNNSTNNNTTNNSNFYENLYYYPPHNNKYSYANNLSSEVCFIYSDFNFNKAPSLRDNLSGIRNIIKNRKKNNIHYLNNIFFSSLCRNRLSQSNKEEYYENRKKDIEILSRNLYNKKKPERNNSCIEFISNKKKIFKEEQINNTKNINTNSNKNVKINRNLNSGSLSTTTNKTINTNKLLDISKDNKNIKNEKFDSKNNTIQEFTNLPSISINNKSNEISINNINNYFNQKFFLTNLNTEQMDFDINDCIYESKDKIKKINEFEIKIYHMKIFQGIQKAQLNLILDKEIYMVQKYIKYIEKIYRKYCLICKNYNYNFQEYIRFLKEVISDMDMELKSTIHKHIQLEYDVDALLNKNINKQKELEKLIDMRNFLYKCKHKDEKIPDINSTLYIENKKYLLAQCLSKLFKNDNNITVIKYLNDIPGKIPDLDNIDNSKFIVRNCPPLLTNNNNNINNLNNSAKNINALKRRKMRQKDLEKEKERMDEYIKKNILNEPEELIEIISFLEDQNRFLLKQNENKRILIEKYKDDLENCIPKEDIEIQNKIIAEVAIKEKILAKIKHRNDILTQQYNYLFNINLKNDIFKKTKKKPKKGEVDKSSFADFNYFQTIHYNFQIKKAKYPGMVFFGKLLKYFLNFLSMNYYSFTKEKFYTHIHPDYLNEILEYSKNMDFNDRNYFLIYQYIIKLLKLYEYICDYVFKKDIELNSNEKNIPLIKKENDKILNKRKLENARAIRNLIENKRINANKQLIEKWLKPEKYISRRIDDNNYKLLLRNKSQDDILKIKRHNKKKCGLNDDINSFVELEED